MSNSSDHEDLKQLVSDCESFMSRAPYLCYDLAKRLIAAAKKVSDSVPHRVVDADQMVRWIYHDPETGEDIECFGTVEDYLSDATTEDGQRIVGKLTSNEEKAVKRDAD